MHYAARPSSNHRGGVMVAFADGHTAFVSDGIDYIAYQSLLTPDNAKSSMPNPGYQLSTTDLGN
jgi:prepilin-type processing-associated H-X9-DG protein